MMNLVFRDSRAVLSCSSCEGSWQVSTCDPFVVQLRELLVEHACDSERVTSIAEWKQSASRPAVP